MAGDARCCTPGHCAKYGSYSVMDCNTNKVVDIQVRTPPIPYEITKPFNIILTNKSTKWHCGRHTPTNNIELVLY